jgi:hypothetical protein
LDSVPLIPTDLALTVALNDLGMGPTVILAVARVLVAPFLLAVPNHLPVDRVATNLLAVVVSAATALAIRLAAHSLIGPEPGRLKTASAIAAARKWQSVSSEV